MPRVAALSPQQQKEVARLYQSGLSAQQISTHFKVGLDATYYALRHQKIPRRSAQETNRIRFEAKPLSYNLKTGLTAKEEHLKISAVMLYWAEGYKAGNASVDFANSDPHMVLIFWKFMSRICRVDENRVRLHLYAYRGQNIQTLMTFWCNLLQLPKTHFTKPYIKEASAIGPRGPRMEHGLVHVRYSDKKLLMQILKWIDEYRSKMLD